MILNYKNDKTVRSACADYPQYIFKQPKFLGSLQENFKSYKINEPFLSRHYKSA